MSKIFLISSLSQPEEEIASKQAASEYKEVKIEHMEETVDKYLM